MRHLIAFRYFFIPVVSHWYYRLKGMVIRHHAAAVTGISPFIMPQSYDIPSEPTDGEAVVPR